MSWLSEAYHQVTGRRISNDIGVGVNGISGPVATTGQTGASDSPPQGSGTIPKAPAANVVKGVEISTVVIIVAVAVVAFIALRK